MFMTSAPVGVLESSSPAFPGRATGGGLRIVCPTYWYPQHASDTQATYVHDINRHLVRRGHSVTVVTPGLASCAATDTFDGVDVIRFPMDLPTDLTYGRVAQSQVNALGKVIRMLVMVHYLEAQYRATVRVAKKLNANVIHAHWAIPTGPAAVQAARRLDLPSVITMHGGDVYVNPSQGYDFPTRWYVRRPLRWTLQSAGALTAITEDCRRHALKAGAPDDSVHLVFNGTDLRRFSPLEGGRKAETPYGPHMIFACRQLFPRKGIRFLIEAAAEIRPRYPDLKVMIAGDGFERPDLEALARRLGIADAVTFLGWVPNSALPPYYRAAAISVIPSLEEGFGIPAAEAMGCEIPVVSSDAGGLPEVVEHGVTGLVVPAGDSHALAGAMDSLLADPLMRRRMGVAGRERALRLFDWDRTAEQFERIYATLGSKAHG
ncbi:MAG TPA: glycosyltransferase [Gemmatimonadales bacterium]|jgi:glycosyltransferase involved in cell wall biosynthesis